VKYRILGLCAPVLGGERRISILTFPRSSRARKREVGWRKGRGRGGGEESLSRDGDDDDGGIPIKVNMFPLRSRCETERTIKSRETPIDREPVFGPLDLHCFLPRDLPKRDLRSISLRDASTRLLRGIVQSASNRICINDRAIGLSRLCPRHKMYLWK